MPMEGEVIILNGIDREYLTEKVTFKLRSEMWESDIVSADIWGKFPKGVNKCQESEAGMGLEDLRHTKETSME